MNIEALSMKLIERSSQRLTLQNRNRPQIARTCGVVCLSAGVLLLTLAQPVLQLIHPYIAQLPQPFVAYIALALMALGAWTIITVTTTRVSFDRHQSRLQIVWHRFLRDVKYTCNLHEIVDVKLEKLVKSYNMPPNVENYYNFNNEVLPQEYVIWRLNLILASGHSLPLTQQFNSDTQNGEDIEKLFSYIKEFLSTQNRFSAT
jgi:hypothetical protein